MNKYLFFISIIFIFWKIKNILYKTFLYFFINNNFIIVINIIKQNVYKCYHFFIYIKILLTHSREEIKKMMYSEVSNFLVWFLKSDTHIYEIHILFVMKKKRIDITLDIDLISNAKDYCVRENIYLSNLINDLLEKYLREK